MSANRPTRHWLLNIAPRWTMMPRRPYRVRWVTRNGTRLLMLAVRHDPELRLLGGYCPDGEFRFVAAPKRHQRRLLAVMRAAPGAAQ